MSKINGLLAFTLAFFVSLTVTALSFAHTIVGKEKSLLSEQEIVTQDRTQVVYPTTHTAP